MSTDRQRDQLEQIMKDLDIKVRKQSKPTKYRCKISYVADGPGGPHRIGPVAWLYVNQKEVGSIFYKEDPADDEAKEVEIELNEHLKNGFNTIKFSTNVDNGIFGKPGKSKARIKVYANGKRIVDEKYKTTPMIRVVEDSWLIAVQGEALQ